MKRCVVVKGAGFFHLGQDLPLYSYLNGGVKRCIAARGAGEVRMNSGNKKTAQLLVLALNIFAFAKYSFTKASYRVQTQE